MISYGQFKQKITTIKKKKVLHSSISVSYTHLDVYKRQPDELRDADNGGLCVDILGGTVSVR